MLQEFREPTGIRKMLGTARMIRGRNVAIEVAAAGAGFSGKKSDEGQANPKSESKWLQELLFGVLERGIDGIDGGDGQTGTSKLRIARWMESTPKLGREQCDSNDERAWLELSCGPGCLFAMFRVRSARPFLFA